MNLKNAFGANGFIRETYSGGMTEYVPEMKLRRLYLSNYILSPNNATSYDKFFLTTSWQGFTIKQTLQDMTDLGIDVIWTTAGCFKDQTIYTDSPPDGAEKNGGNIQENFVMPINVADNPALAATYSRIERLVWNVARMYGNNPAGGLIASELSDGTDDPSFYPTSLTGGPNNNGTGFNTVKYIEIHNEWNLTELMGAEGGSVKFTSDTYSVMFKVCYDAIKDADPNMKVIAGGLYDDGNMNTQNELYASLETAFGGTVPADVIFNWHIYPCDPLGDTDPVNGSKTFENIVIPSTILGGSVSGTYIRLIKAWDAIGHDWMMTEYSWDTSPNSDRTVPILTGLTGTAQEQAEKSMGILDVRGALLTLASKRCVGVVKYLLVDATTNAAASLRFSTMGTYTNVGAGNGTGAPKACVPFYEDFMTYFGDCTLPLQLVRFTDNDYVVAGRKANGDTVKASWGTNGTITFTNL